MSQIYSEHPDSKRVPRNPVGFTNLQNNDENIETESLSGLNVSEKDIMKNGKIVIYFGDKITYQDNFDKDEVRQSFTDMDPALLFIANHFVEDLIFKAQEEVKRRLESESEMEDLPRDPYVAEDDHPSDEGPNVQERLQNRWKNFFNVLLRCLSGVEE